MRERLKQRSKAVSVYCYCMNGNNISQTQHRIQEPNNSLKAAVVVAAATTTAALKLHQRKRPKVSFAQSVVLYIYIYDIIIKQNKL